MTIPKTENRIPEFDHNLVIPPYNGDAPTNPRGLSPYRCTSLELCERFSYSKERIEILKGFINFRMILNQLGITIGFQWLDGSFLEDVERKEERAPRDLDLVTFYGCISMDDQEVIKEKFPEFFSSVLAKEKFALDHFVVDYTAHPEHTVEYTRYWIQLFSHNRDQVWKGMLRLELNTPEIDQLALDYLNNK